MREGPPAPRVIHARVLAHELCFVTEPGLFSPRRIDTGTRHMLELAGFAPGERVLDLGCGYGVVGVVAAKAVGTPETVWLVDDDPLAVACAKRNVELNQVQGATVLRSDGLAGLGAARFDVILVNPPYHADFSLPKRFIEKGFNRLVQGGRMLVVTKRVRWYDNKLRAIFGGCRRIRRGEYSVFVAEKRMATYANRR